MNRDQIHSYWDQRAAENTTNLRATTDDIWLRKLEITVLRESLQELGISKGRLLDVGCGDGYSTLKLAESMPELNIIGVDYSPNMVDNARRRLDQMPEIAGRVSFQVSDATRLDTLTPDQSFDAAVTDRCLINLETFAAQEIAITQIARRLRPGGVYFAIENFVDGQENLNAARRKMGLPPLSIRWHNLYFVEADFLRSANRYFDLISLKEFSSSYYFATRVLYSAMCQKRGETPDYDHDIHRLAVDLPWVGRFSPIRLAVLRRR